jgi:subtilisin family serine protease
MLTGQGVTVSHIDSGARVTHSALRANFLGTYGWYDPQNKTKFPYDLHSHGTHTLATAVGANG